MTHVNNKQVATPETPVIQMTDAAIEKIKNMMAREEKSGFGLRLSVVTGGCAGLSYDLRFTKKPYDNDVIVHLNGLDVYINPESVAFLKGIKIDYVDTLKESGFKYSNPNAQSSCGCGTSFS
jgi:iron-sulfur cluster assembly accessory protein